MAVGAQRPERAQAAHVALAARGHALVQPVHLGRDLARHLVTVALFLFQRLVAPALELAETAVEPPGHALVDPERGPRQVLQEAPVMADQYQRRANGGQLFFQPFDRRQVEVVGRLVEQQDIRFRRQHAGERAAP